jgi:hypothetical protein
MMEKMMACSLRKNCDAVDSLITSSLSTGQLQTHFTNTTTTQLPERNENITIVKVQI